MAEAMEMHKRGQRGAAISEAGPALLVLFILILIPMIDMMSMAAFFACGWYLNHLETREFSVRKKAETQADKDMVVADIRREFLRNPLARFIGTTSGDIAAADVSYLANPEPLVRVRTTLTGRPFLTVGFLSGVPGVGGPMTYTFSDQRPREVTQ